MVAEAADAFAAALAARVADEPQLRWQGMPSDEFPLQRAYRRARAVQLWADALIAPAR